MTTLISQSFKWILSNWISILVLCIFVVFFISRLLIFGNHFTHYDDIFGPYLIQVISNYDQEYFIAQVEKYGSSLGPDIQAFIISNFVQNELFFSFIKRMIGALSISMVSTFAPIQFFLTSLLLNFDLPYSDFIKVMRLPSLIFSFGSFALILLFARSFHGSLRTILITCGTSLLTISWMLIIYTAQSENFLLGLFCIFLLFYVIQKLYLSTLSLGRSILLGALLSLLCFSHYQVMFFLPGFYLGYLFSQNSESLRRRFLSLVPAGFINLFSVAVIYLLFLSSRLGVNPGVHWNAGLNNEFVWDPKFFETGLIDAVFNFISFFLVNSIKVLYGIFGFRESFDLLSIIFSCFLLMLAIYGLYKLCRSPAYRHLSIFILVTIFVWVFLVCIQKLTFSPTRHSIALIPIIITLFSFGVHGVFLKLRLSRKWKNILIISFCTLTISAFSASYSKIFDQRTNPFLYDVDILKLVKEFNVTEIAAYGHTGDLNFYPEINKNFDIKWSNKHPYTHVMIQSGQESLVNRNTSLMIVCANSVICGNLDSERLALKELNFVQSKLDKAVEPLFSYSADSNITNCFSNMAGSGTRRIYLKIFNNSKDL